MTSEEKKYHSHTCILCSKAVVCDLSYCHLRYCTKCVDEMKTYADSKNVRLLIGVGMGGPSVGLSYHGGPGSKMIHRSHEQTKEFDVKKAVDEILRAADRNRKAQERRWKGW